MRYKHIEFLIISVGKGAFIMTSLIVGMFYLYFPEDKSEYIPAFISFLLFMIICILTYRFFVKLSRREENKAKELEKKLKIHDKINYDKDERTDLK
jgi:putative Mn2+ efflux pump MntP